jgi:hypothetical protein
MAKFEKGQSGNPAGRTPGQPVRMTLAVKEAILTVFDSMGGTDELLHWAKANPTIFYTKLLSKLIPLDMNIQASHTIDLKENTERITRALRGDAAVVVSTDTSDTTPQLPKPN